MKRQTAIRQEMNRDLMRIYREVSANSSCRSQKAAYELTINHAAPRFYVDVRWAHQRLSPLMRGDRSTLEQLNPLQRQMYEDLFDVVMRLQQKERFSGRTLHYILRYAVNEPAPRFYIDVRRMRQIWESEVRRIRTAAITTT